MDDIVWAKGGVSPGTKAIEIDGDQFGDVTAVVYSDNVDWVKIPDDDNMGRWAGKKARVLDTHRYPCPCDPSHMTKWHRLDGPFWCIECAMCSQWAFVEKGEACEWLNQRTS